MPLVAGVAFASDIALDRRERAISRLPRAATAVLVVPGAELTVHHARSISDATVRLVVDEALLRATADRCHAPRVQQAALEGELGQLAGLALTSARVHAVVPVTIGERTADTVLASTCVALASVLADADGDTVVLSIGDGPAMTLVESLAVSAGLDPVDASRHDGIRFWAAAGEPLAVPDASAREV